MVQTCGNPLMFVTNAIRDPSGEKLGELADPTFAIRATESSNSLSSPSGRRADAEATNNDVMIVARKTTRRVCSRLNCGLSPNFMFQISTSNVHCEMFGARCRVYTIRFAIG